MHSESLRSAAARALYNVNALPNQQFVGKPYKILHNSIDSLTTAVSKIKEAEELYSLESRIFLESTGIYHYPLFCYLRDKGFNCSVINPIITKNSTNINIRKVHNDRFDSKKAALVGLKPDLKVSLMPSDLALNCRNLCREYYDLMDNRSAYVNKLQGELRMAFPQYLGIFSKVTINTSLTLLETYTSPSAFLEAALNSLDILKAEKRGSLQLLTVRGKSEDIMDKVNSCDPILAEILPLSLEEIFISETEVIGYDIRKLIF